MHRRHVELIGALSARFHVYRLLRSVYDGKVGSLVRRCSSRLLASRRRRHMARAENIVVNRSGLRLRLDPNDHLGQRLFANGGSVNWGLTRLWSNLADEYRPDLILDVGANYGQVAFSRAYHWHPELVLVEANPTLASLLTGTAQLNGWDRATVLNAAASDTDGLVKLYIPNTSTGLASIGRPNSREADYTVADVRTVRLDSAIDVRERTTILAKIDVEGHELRVLDGMRQLMSHSIRFVGVCEFGHLSEVELRTLLNRFQVSLVDRFSLRSVPASLDMLLWSKRSKSRDSYLGDVIIRGR